MIKIVIVDDDLKIQEELRHIIRKIIFTYDNEVKILPFNKCDSRLEREIADVSIPKIYLLDIELAENQSGIQVARKIRENDWDSQIIFMTNHDKMFETVYRSVYDVFDFIEKFHDFEMRIEADLKTILAKKFDNKMFCYSAKNVNLQVYLKSILYIYRDANDRKIIMVTDSNSFYVGININDIFEKLDERFIYTKRSCIVNKDRVVMFDWINKIFVLDTGEKVSKLSKKFKKEIEKIWTQD